MKYYYKIMEKEIIISNNLSGIIHITNFTKELGSLLQLPAETVSCINLALEEAIANIIEHAYPDGGKHEIRLKVNIFSDELQFSLIDNGISFNPVSSEESWEALSQEQDFLDKIGIRLIHQLMDEVVYQTYGDHNLLTMKKKTDISIQKKKTMSANICKIDEITIITLEGRLDTVNAQEFEAIIRPLLNDEKTNIVINCEDLSYLSSSGIRSFILLQKNVTKNKGRLALEAMKPEIRKIFDMTGCSSILTIR